MRHVLIVLALAGLAVQATAQTVRLVEVKRTALVNTTPGNTWFIGRNVSSVAWDGTDAYVGGLSFDTSGSAIAKVTPQVGTTNGLYQLAGSFGFQATVATRGIQDIAYRADGRLGVATDFGSGNTNTLRAFSDGGALVSTSTISARANGVHFDPIDNRLTSLSLGSGRVIKVNDDGTTYNDGTKNWDTTTGPIIFLTDSTHRDLTMDGAGNLVFRRQNAVHSADFNAGGNNYINIVQELPSNSTNVNGQNIEFINAGINFNAFSMFSDRRVTAAGQNWTDIVKGYDTAGNAAVTLDYQWLGALGAPATGNGYYDFSYHAPSGTLAVTDFINNNVHIFQVVPTPGALSLAGLAGLVALRRRR